MVTIYDIAVKAKVSPSTVSKVINDYPSIPEETKAKVNRVMKQMNYIPDAGAKALSKGSSYNIGVLAYFGTNISTFRHALFTEILDSFQQEVNSRNYDLLFVSKNLTGRDGTFYQNCVSRSVAGALLFGDFEDEEMKEVIDSNIPKVAFDYMGDKMTGVYSDNYQKMKKMTKHLLDLGHRKIVFIHGEDSDITKYRVQGFKDAIAEAGIPFSDRMLLETLYTDADSVKNITMNLLRRANPPTAIMYPDDYSAMAGISTIREAGLRCPDDISVTGFDGLPIGQTFSPALTTVKQDTDAIGRLLAQKLIENMDDKENAHPELCEVRATFLPGSSTGPVKSTI